MRLRRGVQVHCRTPYAARFRNGRRCKSYPPVNWWFDLPLKGAITTVAPKRGVEGLTPHYHFRQPLPAAVFLCLLILVTRKRVHIFFDADLIRSVVLLKLISDILRYDLFVASHSIYIVPSAPKISRSILVLQIRVPVEDHQTALSLEKSHELCYTQIRRDTYQHVDVIIACLCFNYFYILLLTEFS